MPRDARQQAQFELEEKYSQRLNIWRVRTKRTATLAEWNENDPPMPPFSLWDDVAFAHWFLKSEFAR